LKGKAEFTSLTALRGLAAWWVVFYHFKEYLAPYLPRPLYLAIDHGDLAVDLFFCLSGFVIYYNYRHLNTGSARDILGFYVKRIARIYPSHLTILLAYVGIVVVLMATGRDAYQDGRYSASSFVLNLLAIHNWVPSERLTWNVPSWSISAEFAAYLVFPLILIAILSLGRRPSTLLLLGFVAFAALNLAYAGVDFRLGTAIGKLGVVRCMCQFAMGAVAAHAFMNYALATRRSRMGLYVGSALFLAMAAASVLPTTVAIPLAWVCLVPALAASDGWFRTVPFSRIMVYLGEISYATYMCHYLGQDIFKFVAVRPDQTADLAAVLAALAAVLAASAALYHGIERPWQRRIVRLLVPSREPAAVHHGTSGNG
jgi:peptidoglycan/LPS O-acetylase OafA/YrhL